MHQGPNQANGKPLEELRGSQTARSVSHTTFRDELGEAGTRPMKLSSQLVVLPCESIHRRGVTAVPVVPYASLLGVIVVLVVLVLAQTYYSTAAVGSQLGCAAATGAGERARGEREGERERGRG
eukprot:2947348-Rhodomonas_salina.1